ncbi:MAG: hypothetical protein KDB18_14160, partial [Salinibacterium sp.]|nr:hypothetical protein [Salinibacterium sp.]
GMRYVHVPIRYSGMSEEQLEHIAKTFRDLDGPFYVHCFHGKHRGPAAAAVGRIVRDGVPRTQALAEMRQWCGTSKKYGGLYRLIATRAMPTSAETDASSWQFDAAYQVDGIASAMVAIPRALYNLKDLAKRNFAVDPEHPDIDAANEAAQLHQLMQAACDLEETRESPDDFRGWMSASRDESKALHDLLVRVGNGDQAAIAEAGEAVGRVGSLCDACHVPYRN